MGNFLRLKSEGPSPGSYNLSVTPPHNEISFTKERKGWKQRHVTEVGPGSYEVKGSLAEDKQILSSQHRYASPKIHEIRLDSRKRNDRPVPPLCMAVIT